MSAPARSVSAIIVNYNGGRDVFGCIASLDSDDAVRQIVVVDNASHDGVVEELRRDRPDVFVVENTANLGYAVAANQGADAATQDVLLFLNPDVVLESRCASALAEALVHRPGAAGPVVVREGASDHGSTLNRLGQPFGLPHATARSLYVQGCALATNAAVFRSLGGFDPRFFMFVEDADYCWRVLLAGYEVQLVPSARVLHGGGAATPGGYVRAGRLETTTFRIVHRERYTLAMLLKCASVRRLVILVPVYLARSLAVAAALLVMGNAAAAAGVLAGLAWNARNISETRRRRREAPRNAAGSRDAEARMLRWVGMASVIRRHGLPRTVEHRA